ENLALPPGQYQARLTVDGRSLTQPFNVLIDPRLAEEGVTVADLREQYEHNKRMRAMVQEVNQLVQRVRTAQTQAREAGDQAKLRALDELAAKLITEPVRYGKPGLQAHISYLAGMTTRTDQKVGRDAIERAAVLRQELDAARAEADRVIGSGR